MALALRRSHKVFFFRVNKEPKGGFENKTPGLIFLEPTQYAIAAEFGTLLSSET